jgi:hypothetical protein
MSSVAQLRPERKTTPRQLPRVQIANRWRSSLSQVYNVALPPRLQRAVFVDQLEAMAHGRKL